MIGWLRNFILRRAAITARKDIDRFIDLLRGCSDRELAALLIRVASVRDAVSNETNRASVPGTEAMYEAIIEYETCSLETTVIGASGVKSMIRHLQSKGRQDMVIAWTVWLMSLRCKAYPEIRVAERQMWNELMRGRSYMETHKREELTEAEATEAIDETCWIPPGLEPLSET